MASRMAFLVVVAMVVAANKATTRNKPAPVR